MLLFHGGLPRSGKSYESVVEHLIPAIKKGRKVYARIDGLNFEKIASLAEVTLDRCQDLLQHLTEEQTQHIEQQKFDIGSLIIIDEVQNYWPDKRQPLSAEMTKFVSEHGHQGLDILLMGQEFKDMHKLWKNRVSQKVEFRKLDMVGKAKEYRWILFKAVSPQKFVEVTKGTRPYDEKYFGTYKSFEEGAEGNQLYDDKRANVWNSKAFKLWIPLFGAVFLFAIGYLWWAFYGGGLAEQTTANLPPPPEQKQEIKVPVVAGPPPTVVITQEVLPAKEPEPQKPIDVIDGLSKKYRLRVSAILRSKNSESAMFEWYDDGLKLKERLSLFTLVKLGYTVFIDEDMRYATLTSADGRQYLATQFSTENEGRVPDAKIREVAGYPDRQGFTPPTEENRSSSAGNLADGWGVLGKAPEGVRQPGS
ncbi:zonular occludens toxin family protein [Oxalicibacterium faecigallinarum]|uniref:Zona occludens toxin N-terminal domain-containing protein n=1 Tax=Oxalicibacterium faecigallinarum TaxID=573741 RepID=A0A8J3F2D1_9BURK|nr:zonular occludens toxin domain-containing protein [Oxalicibacterium faecigallinarum]GGI21065.1 hypothetical protein GCM10008066_27200 [Oxalicibacterium faecigallinarum]